MPALSSLQALSQTIVNLAVASFLSAADQAKFTFYRRLVAFMLVNHELPRMTVGDQRGAHKGGRARGGPGEGTRGFEQDTIPITVTPELKEFAINNEKALANLALGRTGARRKLISRAMQIAAALRELMVYFEVENLKWLTTISNWHPTASGTVGANDRWTEATANVYGQLYDIIEATGATSLTMDPGSFKLASTHPSLVGKLGDQSRKNLTEAELLEVFSRIFPQLKSLDVVRSVGDPDDPMSYLADGTTVPHFVMAGKFDIDGYQKNLLMAPENGALPTIDVAGIMALERFDDTGMDGAKAPADAVGNAFVDVRPRNALEDEATIWWGIKPHVIRQKGGAVLRHTYV